MLQTGFANCNFDLGLTAESIGTTHLSNASGDTVNVIFDKAPGEDAPSQGNDRTQEEILADYKAHQEQLIRLQAMLELTDDPAMRAMLEDQITMQNEILAGITEEATAQESHRIN